MADLNATLADRGSRYGDFKDHAEITQDLKKIIYKHLAQRRKRIAHDQMEALDIITQKIGRIINGDANYADSWQDIAGYAQLVANRLNDEGVMPSAHYGEVGRNCDDGISPSWARWARGGGRNHERTGPCLHGL